MATTKFYLKPENKNGLCPIMFVYQDKGEKFKYYTKIQVIKDLWDGKRIKGKSLEVAEQNETLENLERSIKEIQKEALRLKTVFDPETVERKFRLKLNSNSETPELIQLYDQFIEASRATRVPNTVKGYVQVKNKLIEFAEAKNWPLDFNNINKQFYDRFIHFLITDKKLLNNSIGKEIKNLKVFLNYLMDNCFIDQKLNLRSFKVFKEDIDIIHLTADEMTKIYELKDLPQHLEYVKDYFCFECFTGLRFSDISKLRNENIKGDFIEIRTQKTKDKLFVPLNDYAKEILAKYKGKFEDRPIPPTFYNSKSNLYVKDIAEIAGITDVMILEKFCGSERRIIQKPKCDLVTTHTGRKTFITLSHEKGMPVEMIMKITGIKAWNTLKKYLKVSEKAKLIAMNSYWKKENLHAI